MLVAYETDGTTPLANPVVIETTLGATVAELFRLKNETGGSLNTFDFAPGEGLNTPTNEPLSLANNATVLIAVGVDTSAAVTEETRNFVITASGGNELTVPFLVTVVDPNAGAETERRGVGRARRRRGGRRRGSRGR